MRRIEHQIEHGISILLKVFFAPLVDQCTSTIVKLRYNRLARVTKDFFRDIFHIFRAVNQTQDFHAWTISKSREKTRTQGLFILNLAF